VWRPAGTFGVVALLAAWPAAARADLEPPAFAGPSAYAFASDFDPKRLISVRYEAGGEPPITGGSGVSIDTLLEQVLDEWNAVSTSNVQFVRSDVAPADVDLQAVVVWENFTGTDFAGSAGFADPSGLVRLNTAREWTECAPPPNGIVYTPLRSLLLHELGHLAGLGHPEAPDQIMSAFTDVADCALQAGDRDGITARHPEVREDLTVRVVRGDGTTPVPGAQVAGATTGADGLAVLPARARGTSHDLPVAKAGHRGGTFRVRHTGEVHTVRLLRKPVAVDGPAGAVAEGATARFVVRLVETAAGSEVRVPYRVTGEAGADGADFSGASGTLVIPAGATSATIEVRVLSDALGGEAGEAVALELLGGEDADVVRSRAKAAIADAGAPAGLRNVAPPADGTTDGGGSRVGGQSIGDPLPPAPRSSVRVLSFNARGRLVVQLPSQARLQVTVRRGSRVVLRRSTGRRSGRVTLALGRRLGRGTYVVQVRATGAKGTTTARYTLRVR
jgi:hypothetical protein